MVRMARTLRRLALYVSVVLACLIVLFPVYWMLVTTVRSTRYTMSYPPGLIPEEMRWSAFLELFQTVAIGTWLRNSALVSAGVTLLCVGLAILGAYALSAFEWRGRRIFGIALLGTQMLPEALLVIPIFIIFRALGLIDTLPSLVLTDTAFAVPVAVWILKGFFDKVPREVREAALVDGCTPLSILWRIVLPISYPALVAVAVIAFFDGWNEYLFASTFITSAGLRLATVGLASFVGELATPVELVFAATVVFAVPPVAFYFFMQRHLVSGLTGGAVKG